MFGDCNHCGRKISECECDHALLEKVEALEEERDEALALVRHAAEAAREIRKRLFIGQRIPEALAAVDEYNALLSALAHRDGMTEIEKAREAVVRAAMHYVFSIKDYNLVDDGSLETACRRLKAAYITEKTGQEKGESE